MHALFHNATNSNLVHLIMHGFKVVSHFSLKFIQWTQFVLLCVYLKPALAGLVPVSGGWMHLQTRLYRNRALPKASVLFPPSLFYRPRQCTEVVDCGSGRRRPSRHRRAEWGLQGSCYTVTSLNQRGCHMPQSHCLDQILSSSWCLIQRITKVHPDCKMTR